LAALLLAAAGTVSPVAPAAPATRAPPSPVTPAAAASSPYHLVSVSDDERPSNGHTYFADIDGSGRRVVFESLGENLTTADRAGPHPDIFLRDLRAGTTRLVSRDSRGRPARAAWNPSVSPNGRYVAFCTTDALTAHDSRPTYDPPGTLDPDTDVFVRDRRTGTTRRASATPRGREADGWSCQPSVADTGDVVFLSAASNLVSGDRNGVYDVYLYDRSRRHVQRVSRHARGADLGRISGDGQVVLFFTGARMVRGDRDDLPEPYLYLRRSDGYRRLAHEASGAPLRAACDPVGHDLSYTGRFAVFSCRDGRIIEPPVPDKSSHLFWVDHRRDDYRLLNVSPSDPSAVFGAAISGDGSRVVYAADGGSYGGLPAETNSNLYGWERGAGVTNLTPGESAWWGHYTQEISGDGSVIVFTTDDPALSDEDLDVGYEHQTDLFWRRMP
jgi:Tol biopolymer transport system component